MPVWAKPASGLVRDILTTYSFYVNLYPKGFQSLISWYLFTIKACKSASLVALRQCASLRPAVGCELMKSLFRPTLQWEVVLVRSFYCPTLFTNLQAKLRQKQPRSVVRIVVAIDICLYDKQYDPFVSAKWKLCGGIPLVQWNTLFFRYKYKAQSVHFVIAIVVFYLWSWRLFSAMVRCIN